MADRKEYYKQWKKDNEEHVRQYNAERYKQNKDEILAKGKAWKDAHPERLTQNATCDVCGAVVRRHHLARHKETTKCKTYKK